MPARKVTTAMLIPRTGPRVDSTPPESSAPRAAAAATAAPSSHAGCVEGFSHGYALDVQDMSSAQIARVMKRSQETTLAEPTWTRPSSQSDAPTVLVSDARSLCVRDGDSVARLDPTTGKAAWQATVPGGLPEKSLGVWEAADGTVLVAGRDNVVRGLDGATGRETWSLDLGDRFANPVHIHGDQVVVLRKVDDQLQVCRLDTAGAPRQTVSLGKWDNPIGDQGCTAEVTGVDPMGNLLVKGSVKRPPEPGATWCPTDYKTFVVTPYGHVPFGFDGLDGVDSFAGDPDRVFQVSYDSAGAYSRTDGTPLWKLDRVPERMDPKYGAMGNNLWSIGGQAEYKYIKFVDSRDSQVIMQGYKERTIGVTQTSEELVCIDAADPNRAIWRQPTEGSIFKGPLYVDGDLLIHVKSEDNGIIEALDPATGTPKWTATLKDPEAGQRVTGTPAPGFVSVSRESAGNYRVARGSDGTVFVRTFKGIFGLDPATGLVRQGIKTSHEIAQFVLTPDEHGVYVTNNETSEVRLYPLETQEERVQRVADEISADDTATQAGSAGKVDVQATEVVINGIRLPRHIIAD